MYSISVQLLCCGILLAHGLDPGVEHLRLLSTLVIEPVLDPMRFQIRLSPNPPLRSLAPHLWGDATDNAGLIASAASSRGVQCAIGRPDEAGSSHDSATFPTICSEVNVAGAPERGSSASTSSIPPTLTAPVHPYPLAVQPQGEVQTPSTLAPHAHRAAIDP